MQAAGGASLGFRDTLGVLRLRKWTVLAATAVVLGPVLLFSFLQKPVYSSQAEVLVKPFSLPSSGATGAEALNVATESKVAASLPVATLAAKSLGPPAAAPDSLLGNLSVTADPSTNIMTFAYTSQGRRVAQQGAQAFVQAYLANRRQQMADDLLASSRSVQDQISLLNDRLTALNRQIATTGDPSRKQSLQADASLLVSQIALQQQSLGQLIPPDTTQLGQMLQPATLPTSPVSPKHVRDAALGLFVGLGLGVVAAILRERLDDTLRDVEAIEARAELPVLAAIPKMKARGNTIPTSQVVVAQLPGSPASIAYRKLRTVLLTPGADRVPRTLLVTSSDNHQASSIAAANLAAALGLAGKLVILVCADLRPCSVHTYFRKPGRDPLVEVDGHVGMLPLRGVVNRTGLTDVLAGHANALDALAPTHVENVELLGSGTPCTNLTELLGSEAMTLLLKELQELSDVVVIHAAPVLEGADAVTLARAVDATVLVAEAGSTTQGNLGQACEELRRVTANVAGVVLTNVDAPAGR
jgi:Mrp family chromosome partitioning ATPase/capsular polysaccharide biosynthesis protein